MKILTISVHPDDETLGCGGTLLKHAAAGDSLYWTIITCAHEPEWPAELIEKKADEVSAVAEAYGMEQVFRLGFPTTRLDVTPQSDMLSSLRDVIAEVRPNVVYMIHHGDIHTDHHAAYTAVMSVLKPFYMEQLGVHRLLSYETLSSTDAAPITAARAFLPNVFNDIGHLIDRKISIMELFESEVHSDPFPRGPSAIRALARLRGATIGREYAEAFMLIREVT